MKANELPEKIYVHKSQYWGLIANVDNITKNGVEYTRTDAFIEKACKWLEDNLVQCWIEDFLYVQFKHHEHQEKENVLADFRKAMEE